MSAIDTWNTQVLVLGGGFAGTSAAIRAADRGASVILVDKAYISRSGASALTSGVTCGPTRADDLDEWTQELVARGQYMCDERWTRQLLAGQIDRLEQLLEWGAPIVTDEAGHLKQYLSRGMLKVRCVHYTPKSDDGSPS